MFTVGLVMSWQPCEEYPRKRVEELFAGRESLTSQEVAALDIPAADRLWVLLREEIIPAEVLHELACEFAERALLRERDAGREPDPVYWKAIEAKRTWLRGEIDDERLKLARAATWCAPPTAARSAAEASAMAAARAAAWHATSGAANASECEWQLTRVLEVLP